MEFLTKGPVIQPNDKDSFQQYVDMAQVTYDTLESMGYLNEINADNFEKVIKRLPKWIQAKFAERLKRLESEGHAMPTSGGLSQGASLCLEPSLLQCWTL